MSEHLFYDYVKDFQTLIAAIIALLAAIIAYFSSRNAAMINSRATKENTERQIIERKKEIESNNISRKIAVTITILGILRRFEIVVNRYLINSNGIILTNSPDSNGRLDLNIKNPTVQIFIQESGLFTSLSDEISISDLAVASPSTQHVYHHILMTCTSLDAVYMKLANSIKQNSNGAQLYIFKAEPEGIATFSRQAKDIIEKSTNKLEVEIFNLLGETMLKKEDALNNAEKCEEIATEDTSEIR